MQQCDASRDESVRASLALCDGLGRLLIAGPVHPRPAAGGPGGRQQLRAEADADQPPRAPLQRERGHPGRVPNEYE